MGVVFLLAKELMRRETVLEILGGQLTGQIPVRQGNFP